MAGSCRRNLITSSVGQMDIVNLGYVSLCIGCIQMLCMSELNAVTAHIMVHCPEDV